MSWPDKCPTCGGDWKMRTKTMGAAHGQPHRGRCVNGHIWHEGQPVTTAGRRIVINLGDEASPYPPLIDPADAEPLRDWIGKNITVACSHGNHEGCGGVCAAGSAVVDERPCLCHCHSQRWAPAPKQTERTT